MDPPKLPDIDSDASEAKQCDRLELAKACIDAAHQLLLIAAALVQRAEHEAQRDLAVEVERWLALVSQRAKVLQK